MTRRGGFGGKQIDLALRLYRRCGHGLFAYARSLTGRRESAEDIVQETFLRLLESGKVLSDEVLPSFVYGIARNLAMDLRRQAELRRRHEPQVARSVAARRPVGSEEATLLGVVLAELENLPVDQREVLVLKIVGGLTFEEVGEILQAPASTAASRYRYALEKLSARLAAPEETR
jgi:RNA polymerase sigma-70 factor (ECF subfamily)